MWRCSWRVVAGSLSAESLGCTAGMILRIGNRLPVVPVTILLLGASCHGEGSQEWRYEARILSRTAAGATCARAAWGRGAWTDPVDSAGRGAWPFLWRNTGGPATFAQSVLPGDSLFFVTAVVTSREDTIGHAADSIRAWLGDWRSRVIVNCRLQPVEGFGPPVIVEPASPPEAERSG